MSDEDGTTRSAGDGLRDGMRSIVGILGALKDAIEDTFEELRDSGELSAERAREAARSTMRRAQDTVEEMRERLEFVPRKEFEDLRRELEALRARVDRFHPAPEPAEDAQAGPARAAEGDEGPGPEQTGETSFRFETE